MQNVRFGYPGSPCSFGTASQRTSPARQEWRRFVTNGPDPSGYESEDVEDGPQEPVCFEHLGRAKSSDAVADGLATKAIDLAKRRQAVEAKYYERVKAAIKPRQALRYLQVEHQLLLLIDLQIAAALPIAK